MEQEKEKKSTREPFDSIAELPFPYCVADFAGTGFVAGGAGGAFAHFFRGLRDSPCGHHLAGAAKAVRDGATRVAARWAARLGVLSATRSALSWATVREDDPLVSVASGAVTGALFRLRQGPRAAGRAALVGTVTMCVCEKILADVLEDMENNRPLPEMQGDNPGSGERPLPLLRMPPVTTTAVDKVSMQGPFAAFRDNRRFGG
uniref:Mitochondrial import inner membrane translocase subunit TIM22 n=1 Tax=Leersia perrieri TaxID=77586 RepID=A0A0D9VVA2_9ORYZ